MIDILLLLLLVTGYYVFAGLSVYAYAVIMNKVHVGTYIWYMDEKHIGVCVYPQWLLFWLYWIVRKFRG